MNYIITKNKSFFDQIGNYNFCDLSKLSTIPSEIAIDTETTGLDPKIDDIFCVQIGTGQDNYIVHMYDDNYVFSDIVPYIQNKTLVGQNIVFDLGFFYKYGFYPKKVKDTMIAYKILHNGDVNYMKSDFKTLMENELNVVYDKTDQKNINVVKLSQPSTIEYSFNDVDRLLELHNVLLNQIKNQHYTKTYKLHCKFIRALAYMEQCGLPLDTTLWESKIKIDKENSLKYKREVEEYIYNNVLKYKQNQLNLFDDTIKTTTVKITSSTQMIPVFRELGIQTKDKYGKDSINESVITKTKHEFVDLWLKYQEANHRVTTFGTKILKRVINNRIYSRFNPCVETSRLSSRKGEINFLNFPSDKTTRECFKCEENNVMVVCDYSAQEGVIMADLSGDEAMTASVIDGVDLHCLLAKAVYPELAELSDEEIATKHKAKRTFVKPIRFAFSYGGNGFTIYQNLGVPLKEAEIIYSKFKELHSGLYEWGEKVYNVSVKQGYIESVDGWKLHLHKWNEFKKAKKVIKNMSSFDWQIYKQGRLEHERRELFKEKNPTKKYTPINEEAYKYYVSQKKIVSNFFKAKSSYQRLALNNPVQSRGAHQLKRALYKMFDWILKNNYQNKVLICNAIHDEIVMECPKELAETVKNKLSKVMKKSGDYYLSNLKINADASIGSSWGEAK